MRTKIVSTIFSPRYEPKTAAYKTIRIENLFEKYPFLGDDGMMRGILSYI